jgi:hypothetical protein
VGDMAPTKSETFFKNLTKHFNHLPLAFLLLAKNHQKAMEVSAL